mmetsp:Transcript_7677/g.18301  ORF Transcript_7677/g.18301 Transcript_7677/m.18301 type:complete len:83 (-) Transcript_7677:32-280(-)
MLATGGTALMAIEVLIEAGVPQEKIIFVSIFSCPEGIGRVLDRFPHLTIATATVDSHLNDRKYIVPGVGDFGDRYFGTDKLP